MYELRTEQIVPRPQGEVRYEVPGGALIHKLIVKRDIAKIIRYRFEALEELFGASKSGT